MCRARKFLEHDNKTRVLASYKLEAEAFKYAQGVALRLSITSRVYDTCHQDNIEMEDDNKMGEDVSFFITTSLITRPLALNGSSYAVHNVRGSLCEHWLGLPRKANGYVLISLWLTDLCSRNYVLQEKGLEV